MEHDGNAPFIVNTRSMDLRVLGTSFNIKAYDDENTVITTLVSGKIRQEFPEVGKDVTLTPSRQSIFDRVTGKLETKQTDVQAALAWKEGKIIANNERLEGGIHSALTERCPLLSSFQPVCGSTYNSGISPNNERDSFHLC